jgi:hypothetical protein
MVKYLIGFSRTPVAAESTRQSPFVSLVDCLDGKSDLGLSCQDMMIPIIECSRSIVVGADGKVDSESSQQGNGSPRRLARREPRVHADSPVYPKAPSSGNR